MVAISLYRGKLHRIPPDVPRRWLMPTRRISLQDFKLLVHKRGKALSRLHSANLVEKEIQERTVGEKDLNSQSNVGSSAAADIATVDESIGAAAPAGEGPSEARETDASITSLVEKTNCSQERADQEAGDGAKRGSKDLSEEKAAASLVYQPTEVKVEVDATSSKEKRKREIEEKLQTLNERKHQMVQVLRQILKAEEELKKRSSIVPSGVRDMEGGESEDFSNTHARHMQHMHSPSLSGAPLGKPSFSPLQNNTVPYIGRAGYFNPGQAQSSSNAIMNVMASPSRFAPTQGPPGNLATLSVSGTHFVASSPSPAASGGTSATFRDSRLTSPSWN
ncbi:hypothetical protein H6P81_009573 [Aristolochia fimbriata]|uniref:Uncharacterized protein n=1 Tax=Aristolochia fimbriata TaxID=158543 RepID=A0AAV7ELE9_ARIFI|nr:hypothetical protein H6P81_009573 [Aristolochia fimbriata]